MNYLQYGSRKIGFEIKRGNRKKTVAIHVNPTESVTVLSPQCLDEEKIRMILHKKARWIIEKQEQIKKNRNSNSGKQFVSGESFSYLGRHYRLKVIKASADAEGHCRLVNGRFLVEVNENRGEEGKKVTVKRNLINWYLEHAKEKIGERVGRFGQQIRRWPANIEIKNQERRWGSCSPSGKIRFNWKIIMAPISVMDYVIVHELCHLIYPHHSTHFWHMVQSIIPDYKKRRDWLKNFSLQVDGLD
jgi:predicted metal-dependent hydrolase